MFFSPDSSGNPFCFVALSQSKGKTKRLERIAGIASTNYFLKLSIKSTAAACETTLSLK
jgi:hypothetical protein